MGAVDAYFSLEGPRFALPATEVVAVHPPRNAQGSFDKVSPPRARAPHPALGASSFDPDGIIPPPLAEVPDPEPRPKKTTS